MLLGDPHADQPAQAITARSAARLPAHHAVVHAFCAERGPRAPGGQRAGESDEDGAAFTRHLLSCRRPSFGRSQRRAAAEWVVGGGGIVIGAFFNFKVCPKRE